MLGIGFALAAAVCYGASTVVVGRAVRAATPTTVAFVTLLSGAVLIIGVTATGWLVDPGVAEVSLDGLPWVVVAALFMFVVGRLAYYSSIQRIGPSHSAALSATTTLATPLLAVLILGNGLPFTTWLGIIATFAGIAILLSGKRT